MDVVEYFREIIEDVEKLQNILESNSHTDIRLLEENVVKFEKHCQTFSVIISLFDASETETLPALLKVYNILWNLYNTVDNKLEGKYTIQYMYMYLLFDFIKLIS